MKRTKLYDHVCVECHKKFQSYSFKSIYCSTACKNKGRVKWGKFNKDFESEEKRKLLHQPDITIAEIAKMADEENMTYGQYVAKYGQRGTKHGK